MRLPKLSCCEAGTHLIVLPIFLLIVSSSAAQSKSDVARKFDEFGDIYVTDIKARADNFAIELQNNPAAKGFIIVYRSHRDLPGISFRYADRIRRYLVDLRGIRGDRVIAIDGGESPCLIQEFWIAPPNTAPTPRADAYKQSFDNLGSVRKFDEIPIDEESGIGPGTLEGFAEALRHEPHGRAYFIVYAQYYVERGSFDNDGKRVHYKNVYFDPPGSAQQVLNRARRSLIGVSPTMSSRIRLVNGGYRQQAAVELWIVPAGEHAPIATPNSFPPARRANLSR